MTDSEQIPGGEEDPSAAERITELERRVEDDLQARRNDIAALITKVQELAALASDLAQTRETVDSINDDLDHFVQRLTQLEEALKAKQASPRPGTPVVWHQLEPDLAAKLWPQFTDWVIWLADTYAFTDSQLPRCWHQHGAVLQELTGLWTAWLSAHDRNKGDTGAAVYLWQDALGRALDRFSSKWLGQCLNGIHRQRERTAWASDRVYIAEFAQPPPQRNPPCSAASAQPAAAEASPTPAPLPPPEGTTYD